MNNYVKILVSLLLFSLICGAGFSQTNQEIQQANQEMFQLYQEGKKEAAFAIYQDMLNQQAQSVSGKEVQIFPSTEKEIEDFQKHLLGQGIEKSREEIRAYQKDIEKLHREVFEGMMNQDPDRMGIASKKLEKRTNEFMTKNTKKEVPIDTGGNEETSSQEPGTISDTVDTFVDTWGDYISELDEEGNLKAFSDVHRNTPEALTIDESDGIAMTSFKVLGKGGYYAFLKARLWIVEGYGELGRVVGELTSKFWDQ